LITQALHYYKLPMIMKWRKKWIDFLGQLSSILIKILNDIAWNFNWIVFDSIFVFKFNWIEMGWYWKYVCCFYHLWLRYWKENNFKKHLSIPLKEKYKPNRMKFIKPYSCFHYISFNVIIIIGIFKTYIYIMVILGNWENLWGFGW